MAQVHYIGHATVLIDIGHIRVLTDPILRDRLLFLQRHGPNPAPDLLEERPPDLVILSHLHYDHTDLPSLRGLRHATPLIAPRGAGRYLRRHTGLEIYEIAAGETVRVADVEITALPAEHGWAMSVLRPMTTCLSYTLCNHLSVYFAGDTDLFEGMSDIGAQHDLDLALLPVWGFGPRVGGGHLTPLTAARALTMLRPRVAVPIHWGALRYAGPHALWQTVDCMHSPPYAFAEHAACLAPNTEVRVVQPGHSTAIMAANKDSLS
ncbi:MAG: MBL fold metallo-hydrolase [Anaerolineae bacterium]|nr:MBL fold metallo-hydrolase [Anaerolineae bacterium]